MTLPHLDPSTLAGFALDGMAMDRPEGSNKGQALLPTDRASKFLLSEQLEGEVGTEKRAKKKKSSH